MNVLTPSTNLSYLSLLTEIIIFWYYKPIREGISIGLAMVKNYFENNEKHDERNNDKYFRILSDIIIGFLLFLIGLLITL